MRATAAAEPARLTPAEEIRTIIACQKFGTVCTISSEKAIQGFPAGAVMPYAVDACGRIICCLSDLSSHKTDLRQDGRASVVVANAGFSSMADARCSVTGRFDSVTDEAERAACRDAFLQTHPDAYWADFGDFSYFRLNDILQARLIGGFGRAGKVCAQMPPHSHMHVRMFQP
jgi:putative heme iron utilization protein